MTADQSVGCAVGTESAGVLGAFDDALDRFSRALLRGGEPSRAVDRAPAHVRESTVGGLLLAHQPHELGESLPGGVGLRGTFGVGQQQFDLGKKRRLGKEGFRVALVARNAERVAGFADALRAEGITAAALPADLADRDRHVELVADIAERLGLIDVAVLNGLLDQRYLRATLDVDVTGMAHALEGLLLAPLSLTRLVLPGMLERGDGALLYAFGASARNPMPELATVGAAQAGLRNLVSNYHTMLAGKGVYAGMLTIGTLVERSDAAASFDAEEAARRGLELERAEPDDLAEKYWNLYTTRDRVEETVGALAA